jgi:hypothetical protein
MLLSADRLVLRVAPVLLVNSFLRSEFVTEQNVATTQLCGILVAANVDA